MAREEAPAVGIHLGTTYSSVGVWKNGRVDIIPNEQGNRTTPSYVAFADYERLIGHGALYQAHRDPANTIFDITRLIGRRYRDLIAQREVDAWPFKVVAGDNDKPLIVVQYMGEEKLFAPEEILSMVLSKMKDMASNFLGCLVTKAVVTVPAYFNNSQRQSTKDAGEIAGLDVIHTLNEPTAAALAYCLHNKDICKGGCKKRILIFDLGGGTCDVSLLELDEHGVLEVKVTTGDTHLGGQDFDNRMVEHLVEVFRQRHHKDISKNAKCIRRLKTECEKAKRALSSDTGSVTQISIDSLFEGIDFSISFTRARFEDLNKDLFNKCLGILEQCLKDGGVQKRQVDEVVLVGGSTRIPNVQQLLRDFFDGKELSQQINADEAVAYGAAIQAALLQNEGRTTDQRGPDVILLDVAPLSLGLSDPKGFMNVIIPKDTRVPCEMQDIRQTSVDYQSSCCFRIFEGERTMAVDNNLLGEVELRGIRPAPKGEIKFLVIFKMDENGILHVSARNEDNGDVANITISRDKLTLSKEEIARMIREARQFEAQDKERKRAVNAKHELEEYANKIKNLIHESEQSCKLDVIVPRNNPTKSATQSVMSGLFSRSKTKATKGRAADVPRATKAEDDEKEQPQDSREAPPPQPPAIPDRQAVQPQCSRVEEEAPAIGIDLGTTYSCVSVVRNGHVEIILNDQNNRITPSCVAFNQDQLYVGEGAANQAIFNPTNTILEVKRLIGRWFTDESVQSDMKLWPFRVVRGDRNQPLVAVQFKGQEQLYAPEEVSAMILGKMKQVAEVFVGRSITKAVVTVPAYFTDAQREATKVAGSIAGLEVLLVLNEPAAAAIAYSLDKKDACRVGEKRLILIFDLGGGTFDVSLLELDSHGVLVTKAKGGDTHLGGADFTNRLVDHLLGIFERTHKGELQGKGDVRGNHKSMAKLRAECEKAKLILSTTSSYRVQVDSLFAGIDFESVITRAKFKDLNADLFDKCMDSLKQCLEEAEVERESIDDVVLVGGSTRIPKIQKLLKEFFPGKTLCTSLNATEAVAYGAALKAAELFPGTSQVREQIELVDTTPLSLGIERSGGAMTKVVPRNTRIPHTAEDVFCNVDYATGVTIAVYEGEREMVRDNHLLGKFVLEGIEAKPGGTVKILVMFHIDRNGILTVSARILGNSRQESITINNTRLPREEIDGMIRRAERFRHEDEQRRKVADAKSALEGLVVRITRKAGGRNVAGRLGAAERYQLDSAISVAQNWVERESWSPDDLPELERRRLELEFWSMKL